MSSTKAERDALAKLDAAAAAYTGNRAQHKLLWDAVRTLERALDQLDAVRSNDATTPQEPDAPCPPQ